MIARVVRHGTPRGSSGKGKATREWWGWVKRRDYILVRGSGGGFDGGANGGIIANNNLGTSCLRPKRAMLLYAGEQGIVSEDVFSAFEMSLFLLNMFMWKGYISVQI